MKQVVVPGLDVRTWLAGCALANSNIVTERDPVKALQQALRSADVMLEALDSDATTLKRAQARISELEFQLLQHRATEPKIVTKSDRPQGFYSVMPDEKK